MLRSSILRASGRGRRQHLASSLKTYASDAGGNVAMITGVGMMALLATIGTALDHSSMSAKRSDLQAAVDAGVLAAAAFDSDSDRVRERHGLGVIAENLALVGLSDADVTLSIDTDGVVTGRGNFAYEPMILHIVGIDELDVSVVSQAGTEESLLPAEIVFVLDYSSSMDDHYEAMRDAAIELVTDLTADANSDFEFGLVPFAEEVHLTMDGRYAVGGMSGHSWSGCILSRRWPFVVSDRTPNGSQRSQWGQGGSDCDEYTSRGLLVRPLDSDAAGVVAQLSAMEPHHGTNTSLGVEIGYQLLSPNLPFAASSFAEGKQKFMVILSDGELTRGSYGPGDRFTEDQATANLQTVCSAAAARGISVVTVLYETSDVAARAAMQACASQPNLFMEADSGSISERFSLIADLVKADIRLTR